MKKIIAIAIFLVLTAMMSFSQDDGKDKIKGFQVDLGGWLILPFPPKDVRDDMQIFENLPGAENLSKMATFGWMLGNFRGGPILDLEFYFVPIFALGGEIGVLFGPRMDSTDGFGFAIPMLANIRLEIAFFYFQPEVGLILDGGFTKGAGTFISYLLVNGKIGVKIKRVKIFFSFGARLGNLSEISAAISNKASLQMGFGVLIRLTG